MLLLAVELYDHLTAGGERHHDRIRMRLDVQLMRPELLVESLGEPVALFAEAGPDRLDLLLEQCSEPILQSVNVDPWCGGAPNFG